MTRRLAAALLTLLLLHPASAPAAPVTNDLVIYGGTSAGIIAAVQATRLGLTVVVVAPEQHLGGLSSGGLGFTDIGNKQAIGGLSRDFYQRVAAAYRDEAAWKFEARRPYGGQGVKAETNAAAMWVFEPHVAEAVFEDYVRAFHLDVRRGERLLRPGGAVREGDRLVALRTESGAEFAGRMFIDAGYEGDLLAAAGVPYTVGREARATYGETLEIRTEVEEWRPKVFVQRHTIHRGDDLICESRETRAFCVRDPDDRKRIHAVPIPDDVLAKCR